MSPPVIPNDIAVTAASIALTAKAASNSHREKHVCIFLFGVEPTTWEGTTVAAARQQNPCNFMSNKVEKYNGYLVTLQQFSAYTDRGVDV
jgi:nuclear transport factor 2 (NTF2) superfamily protein